MRQRLGRLITVAVVAVLLAGAPVQAQESTYTLTIKNHRFEPTQLEIPANTKVQLVVKNADPTSEEFESTELRREKVIPGGQEGAIYVGPLAPGTYEFFGDFNPQTARGHLIVK